MLNILVTGANGQLGSELKDLSEVSNHQFVFTDVEELDLLDREAVDSFFEGNRPDVCINCAAYTAVDKAEEDSEMAYKINAEAVKNLAENCSKYETVLFQISTDFVFDGNSSIPYTETDSCNPLGVYGASKLKGEEEAFKHSKSYVIRTSWLYSSYGCNFVKTMIRLGTERDQLGVIYDQIGTPTYAKDLAKLIVKMIESNSTEFGLYHFSNEGVASWYDFAHEVFRIKNVQVKLNAIPTAAFPTPAQRPHFSVMSKDKIKNNFDISIRHWAEALEECLNTKSA